MQVSSLSNPGLPLEIRWEGTAAQSWGGTIEPCRSHRSGCGLRLSGHPWPLQGQRSKAGQQRIAERRTQIHVSNFSACGGRLGRLSSRLHSGSHCARSVRQRALPSELSARSAGVPRRGRTFSNRRRLLLPIDPVGLGAVEQRNAQSRWACQSTTVLAAAWADQTGVTQLPASVCTCCATVMGSRKQRRGQAGLPVVGSHQILRRRPAPPLAGRPAAGKLLACCRYGLLFWRRLTVPGTEDNLLHLRTLDVAPIRPGVMQRTRPAVKAPAATDDGLQLQGYDLVPAAGSSTLRLFWETAKVLPTTGSPTSTCTTMGENALHSLTDRQLPA